MNAQVILTGLGEFEEQQHCGKDTQRQRNQVTILVRGEEVDDAGRGGHVGSFPKVLLWQADEDDVVDVPPTSLQKGGDDAGGGEEEEGGGKEGDCDEGEVSGRHCSQKSFDSVKSRPSSGHVHLTIGSLTLLTLTLH